MGRVRELANRVLEAFARWFASPGGVWQTVILTLALAVAETIFPHWDPQGFRLLYWLTVYSAVTQPALAYVAVRNDLKTDAILNHLEEMVARGVTLDEQELEAIKQIRVI